MKGIKPKATVAGRSFVFNAIFVVLNILAIALIVIGFHSSMVDNSIVLKSIGFGLLILSIGMIYVFKGRMMMNNFARVILGGMFIVSGLIKANDPVGFSYKLKEYFEDGALAYRIKEWFGLPEFSLESWMNYALGIAVFVVVLEIVLGVLTIFNQKMKWVSIFIVGMMLFFTFLTWHTANCSGKTKFKDRDRYAANSSIGQLKISQAKTDKEVKVISRNPEIVIDEMKSPQCVNDCGCFGDAMKGSVGRSLTPIESLVKDLVLLYFSIWLLLAAFKSNQVLEDNRTSIWVSSLILIAFLSWVFGWVFLILFALVALLGSIWLLKDEEVNKNVFWKVVVFVTFLSSLLIIYVLLYEPLKDYRPYAVGSNLTEKMQDGKEGKYLNLLVYKNLKTGKEKEFDGSSSEYLSSKIWESKDWKYLRMSTKEVVPSQLASITDQFNPFIKWNEISEAEESIDFIKIKTLPPLTYDLRILDKENDTTITVPKEDYALADFSVKNFTIQDTIPAIRQNLLDEDIFVRDFILNAPKMIILIAGNLKEANWSNINVLKSILADSEKDNVPMIMLSSSSREEINAFRKKYGFKIPTFTNDETELKVIARSNPSVLILKKGVVKGKYPFRASPDYDWLKKNVLK
jgi:uncharacterized membrane protein YphA (DoxX/SURF4 family)